MDPHVSRLVRPVTKGIWSSHDHFYNKVTVQLPYDHKYSFFFFLSAHSKVYNILRKQAISIPIHSNDNCLAIAILGF